MTQLYARFLVWQASDEGATAVEYGILVALIAIAIVAAVSAVATGLNTTLNHAATHITTTP
jgi:pilus assembly protein Flp/PilA